MNLSFPKRILCLFSSTLLFSLPAVSQMHVDSFSGSVTQNEIDSFKSYITGLTPATDNIGNNWAQGHSGEQTKAMGLVYEITGDTAILDQMIRFCDAVLSERNDLAPAPVGQHVIWTGGIDPVWPNDITTQPIGTGGEQGDPIGHLGNCARLILQTPAIWSQTVSIGDPDGYGVTYLDRAKTYVRQADVAVDGHVLKYLLDLSQSDHQYFSTAGPYQPGHAVPWNQQMMFNYGFQNLATAHEILRDDSSRVTRYRQIVQDSMNWFFSTVTTYTDKSGNTAYNWGYEMPSVKGEDSNHGSLDIAGFYRAYMTGNYGMTADMMKPFANMFVDVMILGPKDYAGRVDGTSGTGHSSATTSIRSGYLFLAEFRPDAYFNMMGADLTEGGTTGSIDTFSRFLWVKNKRAAVAEDLTGKITVKPILSAYVSETGTVDQLLLLRNTTKDRLQGPFYVTLSQVPTGVTLDNAFAFGSESGPAVEVPFLQQARPGQVALVLLELRSPTQQAGNIIYQIYSGEPQ